MIRRWGLVLSLFAVLTAPHLPAIAQTVYSTLGGMAYQNANAVVITGGTINGAIIGGSSPAAITGTSITGSGTVQSSTSSGSAVLAAITNDAAGSSVVQISGGTNNNVGPYFTLLRGGVTKAYIGTLSAVAGGAASDFSILTAAGLGLYFYSNNGAFSHQFDAVGHAIYSGTAPGSLTGCGTSSSIAGNDNVGRITIGTGPGGSCAITFANAWATAPVCHAQNETTANAIRATATTSGLTMTGTLTASDKVTYSCTGY